jgi:hypothetical protein
MIGIAFIVLTRALDLEAVTCLVYGSARNRTQNSYSCDGRRCVGENASSYNMRVYNVETVCCTFEPLKEKYFTSAYT